MAIKQEFDLHYQFKLFLDRCEIDMAKMPADQYREMKRAFFGACGQMLILLRDDVADYEEKEASEIMIDMLDQVMKYWVNEQKNQN